MYYSSIKQGAKFAQNLKVHLQMIALSPVTKMSQVQGLRCSQIFVRLSLIN